MIQWPDQHIASLVDLKTVTKIADITLSTTTTTRTVPNLSGYRWLVVYARYNNSTRGSTILPYDLFKLGYENYGCCVMGTATQYWNIAYVSDTQVSNWSSSSQLSSMTIYGIK